MNPKKTVTFLIALCITSVVIAAQDKSKSDLPEPRAKDGKKLLTSMDLMKIKSVGNPRISPDGSRVAYTVGEVKMEKDKEWKTATQIWVVAINDQKTRQFTRGEKNASAPEWSADGSMLAFLSDREKDGERQVWMMNADGSQIRQLTDNLATDYSPAVSPDGRYLVFLSKRSGNFHLWRADIDGSNPKQLTIVPSSGRLDFSPDS